MAVRPAPCEAHVDQASPESQSRLEVADILRRFGPSYAQAHVVSPFEQRLIDDLITCRTARLGGHLERCAQCGFERQAYKYLCTIIFILSGAGSATFGANASFLEEKI